MSDGGRALGTGDEVGDARNHTHSDVGPELFQCLGEDPDVATRQDLSILETWISSCSSLVVGMTTDVRVPD